MDQVHIVDYLFYMYDIGVLYLHRRSECMPGRLCWAGQESEWQSGLSGMLTTGL